MYGNPYGYIKQMYDECKAAADPDKYLQNLIQSNPVLANIANNGGDLQQTFYQLCKLRGVNPDDILNGIQR